MLLDPLRFFLLEDFLFCFVNASKEETPESMLLDESTERVMVAEGGDVFAFCIGWELAWLMIGGCEKENARKTWWK